MPIADGMESSADPEDIKRCLRSGVVPKVYCEYIKQTGEDGAPRIDAIRVYGDEGPANIEDPEELTDEQMMELAVKGNFVRNIGKDKVYCPMGQVLRRKSVKPNNCIRYCIKLACRNCMNKCFDGSSCMTGWKEMDFIPGQTVKPSDKSQVHSASKIRRKETRKEVVTYRFIPDLKKLENRKYLSEHPFGTLKRHRSGDFSPVLRLQPHQGS